MTPSQISPPSRRPSSSDRLFAARWHRIVAGAVLLVTAVPIAAGTVRLIGLASGIAVTPENARFVASPWPVVVHIPAACLFAVLGVFQFAPGLRRRGRRWHRLSGRLLVLCGLAAGLTGLWMAVAYPDAPGDGGLLRGMRLVVGLAMVASLVLGTAAILRRDVERHQVWMVRGYALGMGAITQVVVLGPWAVLAGSPTGLTRALLMGLGWAINLALAEALLWRGRSARVR